METVNFEYFEVTLQNLVGIFFQNFRHIGTYMPFLCRFLQVKHRQIPIKNAGNFGSGQ